MHKVLLTGASGFLGRHCLQLLASQYELHAVSRARETPSNPNIHWHQIDLFQTGRVTTLLREIRPTHLLHLAWATDPDTYRDSPENLNWLAASVHLLRAFGENGGRRVVMAGSCAEYDWSQGVCDEATTPLRPANLYGACKNALREVLESYAEQIGLSAAWGRIFFLYGAGEHPDRFFSYVIRSLVGGKPARCSNGTQRLDYIHVEDAANAFVALLSASVGGVMNIGTGEAMEIATLARLIGSRLGRCELIQFGAVQTQDSEVSLVVAGQRRARFELGWSPKRTLDQGLNELIDFWKRQLAQA